MAHTAHCIEMAKMSIEENQLDTLADEFPGRTWTNREIAEEIDARVAAGSMREATDDLAVEWLAEGTVTCIDKCKR